MPEIVQIDPVPARYATLTPLEPDYVDVFAVEHGPAGTAEDWARAALEGASRLGRAFAWQAVLGLRLEPAPSPDRVAGWPIVDRGADHLRLEAKSWSLTANVLFVVDDERASFVTMIRYDRRAGRIVWAPVAPVHRRLAMNVMHHALRRMARRRAGA
ncbi:MAG TPA: hypothetical protein VM600_05985 [Actinomycetota bacterium]|nr:hypothetical protein [Actinomycetota bacterium]